MKEMFTEWVKFFERENIFQGKGIKLPGIYAIAFDTEDKLSGNPFEYNEKIVYFGMTKQEGGLKSRLQQFDSTINYGKSLHGGASRFIRYYESKEKIKGWKDHLYVSIWPFGLGDFSIKDLENGSFKPEDKDKAAKTYEIIGEIVKAEYLCFSKYIAKFNRISKFNNQKDYPK